MLYSPAYLFDAPQVLDASSTNIPGSASSTLQVIADTAASIQRIQYFCGIGKFIGIYRGGVGAETLVGVMGGNGLNTIDVDIPENVRVSLRSLEAPAITTGKICCIFLRFYR